ncbi:hypothetical protein [Hymenobacter bucti]|uniref:Uncharacterized protein n=1 Tax=Hymenobacter bucti TaxID=1844114 RepID=A0ABW4QXE0_9BACT
MSTLLTLEQRAERSARAGARYHTNKALGIKPALPKPKHAEVQQQLETARCFNPAPDKPVSAAERWQPTANLERPRYEQAAPQPPVPWFAYPTAKQRREAILSKLDREQPLPTYHQR